MSAADLLARAESIGVVVVVEGDRLKLRWQGPEPPEELRAKLRARKQELIAHLRQPPAAPNAKDVEQRAALVEPPGKPTAPEASVQCFLEEARCFLGSDLPEDLGALHRLYLGWMEGAKMPTLTFEAFAAELGSQLDRAHPGPESRPCSGGAEVAESSGETAIPAGMPGPARGEQGPRRVRKCQGHVAKCPRMPPIGTGNGRGEEDRLAQQNATSQAWAARCLLLTFEAAVQAGGAA